MLLHGSGKMFQDKRWIIPLFIVILIVISQTFFYSKICLIFIIGVIIYKSYQLSFFKLIKQHASFISIIIIYYVIAHFSFTTNIYNLVFSTIKAILMLILALMLNTLICDKDIIASISLYLRLLKKKNGRLI